MDSAEHPERPLYCYRFDDVEFDEARASLRVAGEPVELERRPLQVLALLLRQVGEVVPRAELFDTVWGGRPTVDNVLSNAIAKLRKGLGVRARARIVTAPRVGYRIKGPVERIVAGHRTGAPFKLTAGQTVPGREHFILRECLDPAAGGSVWLVRHDKTSVQRVYKFAVDGEHLAALKREVTIHRVLHETLGERDDLVRVIDWNFDTPPCWLQSEYAGRDLVRWAQEEGAFSETSLEQRVAWFLQIADAIAAAHGAGVLHKDLKPSNVLVAPRGDGWQFRVADFGSGRLLESGRLEELGITRLGMTVTSGLPADSGMTLLYVAPEVLSGAAPSVRSDVYALGLMLFQMVVGDLRRTLAPGWEQSVDDELLCEDIAAATSGDPDRRLASVDALTQRLRSHDARAIERKRLRDSDARALAAERLLERSRARRPWLIAAIMLLALGLGVSLWQIQRVRAARTEARHQATLAQATNRFLNEDLLGAGIGGNSPAWYESNPTLGQVLDAAAPRVDERFAGNPLILATLHQTLGRAYKSTGDYKKAFVQLQASAKNWQLAVGATDARTILVQYDLAAVLTRVSQPRQAEAMLERADAAAGDRLKAGTELALQSHLAHAVVAFQQLHVKQALPEYLAAQRLQVQLHPANVAMSASILLGIAACQIRMQKYAAAEKVARKILSGAPYTQQAIGLSRIADARMRLSDVLRAQNKFKAAIPVTRKALAEYTAAQGKDSQPAITTLSTLAFIYSWTGDNAKALKLQREVYQRAVTHWGAMSQSALNELLNLGGDEYAAGDRKSAVLHYRQAEAGLVKVYGPKAPMVQAARVWLAEALSDSGHNKQALAMIRSVDPVAYQASTSAPGRALALRALEAEIEVRMHKPGAVARLRAAIKAMQAGGLDPKEIATFQKELPQDGDRPSVQVASNPGTSAKAH